MMIEAFPNWFIPTLFLHFFDTHFLEVRGMERNQGPGFYEARLATRFAVLSSDEVLLPAASFFESSICSTIVNELQLFFSIGAIRLVGNASSIVEFSQKKLTQYRKGSRQFESYRSSMDLEFPAFRTRERSSTNDIVTDWINRLDEDSFPFAIFGTNTKLVPKGFERRLENLPNDLGKEAFVVDHVIPRIFNKGELRSNISVRNRLHSIINSAYFESFTREFNAGTVKDLVYLDAQPPIQSFGHDISYKNLIKKSVERGLRKQIENASAEELQELRVSAAWRTILDEVQTQTTQQEDLEKEFEKRGIVYSKPPSQPRLFPRTTEFTKVIHEPMNVKTEATPIRNPANSGLPDETIMNETFFNGSALLIGIGADLPVTVQDATGIYNVLVDPNRARYDPSRVKLLTEKLASKKEIMDALDRLVAESEKNHESTVIIFFSGHGGRIASRAGVTEYFLVPNDVAPTRFGQTSISGRDFMQKINKIEAKKILVLFDCCHAGGLQTPKALPKQLTKSAVPADELLKELGLGKGRVVLASSTAEEVSWTGTPYSVFTACLLEALEGKGSSSTDRTAKLLDVLKYVLDQVPQRTQDKQHPFVSEIQGLDSNFPICFYPSGKRVDELPAADLGSPAKIGSSVFNTGKLERAKAKLEAAQGEWHTRYNKMKALRHKRAVETSTGVQFQLDDEIESENKAITKLEVEIEELEAQISDCSK